MSDRDPFTRSLLRRVARRAERQTLTIEGLQDQLSDLVTEVRRLFKTPVLVSIVVRDPDCPDHTRDVFIGSDSAGGAISAIRGVTDPGSLGAGRTVEMPPRSDDGRVPVLPPPEHEPRPLRDVGVRLAVRTEGDRVNAYLAQSGTMDGAQLVASIERSALVDEKLWEDWKAALSSWLNREVERVSGAAAGSVVSREMRP